MTAVPAGRLPLAALRLLTLVLATTLTACAAATAPGESHTPASVKLDAFCLEAQRVVVRTTATPALVVHDDFDAFVRSKAIIDPLTIQQFLWREDGLSGAPVMISCKLKSADHLNEAFGAGTSAGNGRCQDMNRLTYSRVQASLGTAATPPVVFDPEEFVKNEENPGMTGPDWLRPYEMTWRDSGGVLHVRSKGFRVDWLDPSLAEMPARFRGVQYCHFIAPDYLERLLRGEAESGIIVGKVVVAAPPPDLRPAPGIPAEGSPH